MYKNETGYVPPHRRYFARTVSGCPIALNSQLMTGPLSPTKVPFTMIVFFPVLNTGTFTGTV
jgi:hypothetical protein